MSGRVEGRVAVVTGAAGGFGKAIVQRLLDEGAKVALWDNREDRLAAFVEEVDPGGERSCSLVVDVADSASVDAAAQATRKALGPIDILVNNAGISGVAEPWEESDESWRRTMAINADGTFWCIRACLPDMRERRYGKIVNIGSLSAQQGRPTTNPAYPASKGAVLGLTVSLSNHLGEYGITVNAINPGYIRTEIHDQFGAEARAVLEKGIPLDRRGEPGARGLPEDIAGAVLYLASPDSDFVTGEFLSVNGGSRTGS